MRQRGKSTSPQPPEGQGLQGREGSTVEGMRGATSRGGREAPKRRRGHRRQEGGSARRPARGMSSFTSRSPRPRVIVTPCPLPLPSSPTLGLWERGGCGRCVTVPSVPRRLTWWPSPPGPSARPPRGSPGLRRLAVSSRLCQALPSPPAGPGAASRPSTPSRSAGDAAKGRPAADSGGAAVVAAFSLPLTPGYGSWLRPAVARFGPRRVSVTDLGSADGPRRRPLAGRSPPGAAPAGG
jgi:hypothetical protein